MSPFCAADVAIIRGGGTGAPLNRADCGCERFWKTRIPATATIIAMATTTQTQRRRFLPDGDLEGAVEDSAEDTASGVASVFLPRSGCRFISHYGMKVSYCVTPFTKTGS